MQFRRLSFATLFVLICQFSVAADPASEVLDAPALRISTGDFSPWTDKNATHGGFVNRVVKEAFRREGYEVKFLYWPWKRSLETARIGKVDASSFWYVSDEKVKDFIYSDPVSEHKELFFYLKEKNIPAWTQLSDLEGLRVGATRSFSYTEEFWQLSKDNILNVLDANSDELNFKKLIAGRTDVFPAAEVVGWQILKKLKDNPEEQIATLAKPLAKQLGHLIFPKKNENSKKLVEAFNRALASMKSDGTLERYRMDMMHGLN